MSFDTISAKVIELFAYYSSSNISMTVRPDYLVDFVVQNLKLEPGLGPREFSRHLLLALVEVDLCTSIRRELDSGSRLFMAVRNNPQIISSAEDRSVLAITSNGLVALCKAPFCEGIQRKQETLRRLVESISVIRHRVPQQRCITTNSFSKFSSY
jgi:hypothetical protein